MPQNRNIENSTILCWNKEQLFSEIENEIVMLNVPKSEYYNFNNVATTIWNQLCDPISLGALVEELMLKYNVTRQICESDTIEFLNELMKKGLIKITYEKG